MKLLKVFDHFIFAVGCMTIWCYIRERWTHGIDIVFGTVALCFFFWSYFLCPLRDGFKEAAGDRRNPTP